MLITPIFWSADNLTGVRQFVFVQLNPIYRLIDIVRSPLLGIAPICGELRRGNCDHGRGMVSGLLYVPHFP